MINFSHVSSEQVIDLGLVDFDLSVPPFCPSCQATSAKFPLAEAELDRQWNNRNASQQNQVYDQMRRPVLGSFQHDDRNGDADLADNSVYFGGGGRGWRGGGGFQRGFRGGYRGSRGGFYPRGVRGRGYNYGRGGDDRRDPRDWGDSANRGRLPDRLRRRRKSEFQPRNDALV